MATATKKEGYKDHRPGSNKGEVHRIFDKDGAEAARKFGLRRKLADSTLRVWISFFGRTSGKKPPAKSATARRKTAAKK